MANPLAAKARDRVTPSEEAWRAEHANAQDLGAWPIPPEVVAEARQRYQKSEQAIEAYYLVRAVNLSMRAAARRLGVHAATVNRWIRDLDEVAKNGETAMALPEGRLRAGEIGARRKAMVDNLLAPGQSQDTAVQRYMAANAIMGSEERRQGLLAPDRRESVEVQLSLDMVSRDAKARELVERMARLAARGVLPAPKAHAEGAYNNDCIDHANPDAKGALQLSREATAPYPTDADAEGAEGDAPRDAHAQNGRAPTRTGPPPQSAPQTEAPAHNTEKFRPPGRPSGEDAAVPIAEDGDAT